MSDSTNPEEQFTFRISLSVLDHLGRNLYRSFATVLGEAISNSWDACANNVWIYLDRENACLVVHDDGKGMNASEFRDQFLKIGFTKRKKEGATSECNRPFIGRKGIGKLALLSCSARISVLTKREDGDVVGGTIDNKGLDEAIEDDLEPSDYILEPLDTEEFEQYTEEFSRGTIIRLDGFRNGMRHTSRHLRKIIALYFRFSLIDPDFNIYVDGNRVTFEDLKDLAERTQFLWVFNHHEDPYLSGLPQDPLRNRKKDIEFEGNMSGFIASVEKPRDLKAMGTDEKVSVDLFVNGRMRERDILKHIPTARIAENYFYGQLHFDDLDGTVDRFTSSREGIVADDPVYQEFLVQLRTKVLVMIEDWDKWRLEIKEDGDPDNNRLTKKQRKSTELFNAIAKDYTPKKGSKSRRKVDQWLESLSRDAVFNYESYAECFVAENLIREYIRDEKIPLSKAAKQEVKKWRKTEEDSKNVGNISIAIKENSDELSYLDMDGLANLADKGDANKEARLARDAKEYKPMRNAVAHTGLLTDVAKSRLTSVFQNIQARILKLISK